MPIMPYLHILAYVHIYKCPYDQWTCMPSSTSATGGNHIKRIPVKEPTWRRLHDLKEAGQSYDDLLARMIQRERDYRDWKTIAEIDRTGEFVAFDPDEIMKDG
jgi:predicted CopG family antitoxin